MQKYGNCNVIYSDLVPGSATRLCTELADYETQLTRNKEKISGWLSVLSVGVVLMNTALDSCFVAT